MPSGTLLKAARSRAALPACGDLFRRGIGNLLDRRGGGVEKTHLFGRIQRSRIGGESRGVQRFLRLFRAGVGENVKDLAIVFEFRIRILLLPGIQI
jgi:hypothetical protein